MRARDNKQAIAERYEIISLKMAYIRAIKYHQDGRPKIGVDERIYTVSTQFHRWQYCGSQSSHV
jgi:hypothetical protein